MGVCSLKHQCVATACNVEPTMSVVSVECHPTAARQGHVQCTVHTVSNRAARNPQQCSISQCKPTTKGVRVAIKGSAAVWYVMFLQGVNFPASGSSSVG